MAACGSGGGGSADGSVTMNLGHIFPSGSATDNAAKAFAEAVNERTDGAVKINVFPGGEIGGDEEMATNLSAGTQEAAVLNQSGSGFSARVELGNLPFLVSTEEQADQLFYGDGFIAEFDKETMAQNGIHVLSFVENGFRAFSNSKRPVELPEDIKGLKVRAPSSDLFISIIENWGAQAVAMAFPELYVALEQGTVDGQDNGVTLFRDANFAEVQPYFTDTRYSYATAAIVVSQPVWDSLSEEQQLILQEEADKASVAQREESRANAAEALEEIMSQIDVVTLTDEQLEVWRQSVQPIYDAADEKFGEDVMADLTAALDELRG